MKPAWDDVFDLRLRKHLRLLPDGEPLSPDAKLVELGLDSLGTVWLVTELESAYGFTFPDSDLNPDTLMSPATLWEVVCRLREAA